MFQKFIINRDGVLKLGHVYFDRDMLSALVSNSTYGGGLWKIDEGRGSHGVLLRPSFDWSSDFDYVKER